MQINTSRRSAFTLVEIMIVVAIIGLLAAIAIPNFIKAREASQKNACIANLKQIDGAKNTWALEQKKVNSDSPGDTDLFGTTLYIREKPSCPGGGTYTLGVVSDSHLHPVHCRPHALIRSVIAQAPPLRNGRRGFVFRWGKLRGPVRHSDSNFVALTAVPVW
jgi:prepilin-type N-terminal cleavage/methylation domain-containing protein